MISLILGSSIVVKGKRSIKFNLKSAALSLTFPAHSVTQSRATISSDTDNLLSASDYTNFAFNFHLSVTCKLETILLVFFMDKNNIHLIYH